MKKKIIFTLLILMFGLSVTYAAELVLSKYVTYDNTSSNLNATNVQDALDELYARTETTCEEVSVPNLGEDNKLIPVIISSNGTVKYADTTKNWYNYCEKKWANAVILEDNVSYNVGDTIQESDIESYFVWIPKYKYKLWNTGTASKNAHEIEIIFDETNTTDIEGVSCATPLTTGDSENCNNGEYMTHPAFISMNKNGFWVGKFETGYKGASNASSAQVNANDSSKVIIKPNVYSWRNITLYNIFLTSYNYQRSLDSHMMKNTEWGAVSYLSHSKYGINSKVNINNNDIFLTGYSALPSANRQTYPGIYGHTGAYNQSYNTEVGYLASTTGNISGVYDMSGGTYEYVAGYISGNVGTSGFTTTTIGNYDSRYFDVYNASSAVTTYQYRILGDATGEMGPIQSSAIGSWTGYINSWYTTHSYFVRSDLPWFVRGGYYYYGIVADQFDFGIVSGGVYSDIGFRIILTP